MRAAAAGAIALIASLWVSIYWVEAEKEIVVLCGLSRVGTTSDEIARLHGTASLATLRVQSVGTRSMTVIGSARNMARTRCTVTEDGGVVTASTYHERFRLAPLVSLRRSLGVEDQVPVAALASVAPQTLLGEVMVGLTVLMAVGSFFIVLGRASQRWRWATAIPLLLLVNLGAVLLIGS